MSAVPKPVRQPHPDPTSAVRTLAVRVFGTERAADAWLDLPNPELGGKTPRKLVESGRAEVVEDFLNAALAGNFG
ncbi:MAG: MbcA/ParS/Xre antitoxin family protein [Gemmataceae bacterium]|nr:MbcA/ParS/Xre antitoxin family protein [Gemmataceae bacterium]